MPHCTTDFAWYLGKFLVVFAVMAVLYVDFLKEKEFVCLCKPRERELLRRKGERRSDRCNCIERMRRKVYSCGCKKLLSMQNEANIIINKKDQAQSSQYCCCTTRSY